MMGKFLVENQLDKVSLGVRHREIKPVRGGASGNPLRKQGFLKWLKFQEKEAYG